MTDEFKNKVSLVTGAGGGIGRATAIAFAHAGAKVMVADFNEKDGEQTVRAIKDAGGAAAFVRADVRNFADVKRMVESTVRTFGGLDYAHNNAGIDGEFVPLVQCSEENWNNVLDTNLKSVWMGMKHEIPEMQKRGGGAIVNTGSTASLFGYRTMSHYVASKHAVAGLTRAAALECSLLNIRINCVCPGVIRTQMIDDFMKGVPELEQAMVGMEPMGRMGSPEEVANLVLFLCSPAASFITGAIVSVDGGISAQSGSFPPAPDF